MRNSLQLSTISALAEQCQRYTDTTRYMKYIIDKCKRIGEDLNNEEKNLFNIGYKNLVTIKRRQWRTLVEKYNNVLEKNDDEDDYSKMRLMMVIKTKIEEEIKVLSCEVISLIPQLLENTKTGEGKTFYLKIQADYTRYLAEASQNDAYKKKCDDAKQAYDRAITEAELLHTTHPIRLATALNFSVFIFDILKNIQEAIDTAKSAFDAALFDLSSVDEDNIDETLRVMQLLKDNFTLWGVDLKIEQERNFDRVEQGDENEQEYAAQVLIEARTKDKNKKKRFAPQLQGI